MKLINLRGFNKYDKQILLSMLSINSTVKFYTYGTEFSQNGYRVLVTILSSSELSNLHFWEKYMSEYNAVIYYSPDRSIVDEENIIKVPYADEICITKKVFTEYFYSVRPAYGFDLITNSGDIGFIKHIVELCMSGALTNLLDWIGYALTIKEIISYLVKIYEFINRKIER